MCNRREYALAPKCGIKPLRDINACLVTICLRVRVAQSLMPLFKVPIPNEPVVNSARAENLPHDTKFEYKTALRGPLMTRVTSVARLHLTRGGIRLALLALGAAAVILPVNSQANDFCPNVYKAGALPLNFNPAFLHVDKFNHANGNVYDGLIVTSFFNAIKNPEGTSSVSFYERDLVARITGIGYRSPAWFNADRDVEILTDLDDVDPVAPNGPDQTVWPNEAQRVPDGILSFEAIIVPQGFHPTPSPGRLTLINLDDPTRTEYIVHQSLQNTNTAETGGTGKCRLPDHLDYDPNVQPRFYHLVKWFDMDGDALKDIVTVRSGFKVSGAFCLNQVGEAVWFKNPGAAIDPNTEWQEYVVAGFPSNTAAADISLDVADLEGILGNNILV
jgi:hypothetical protein